MKKGKGDNTLFLDVKSFIFAAEKGVWHTVWHTPCHALNCRQPLTSEPQKLESFFIFIAGAKASM